MQSATWLTRSLANPPAVSLVAASAIRHGLMPMNRKETVDRLSPSRARTEPTHVATAKTERGLGRRYVSVTYVGRPLTHRILPNRDGRIGRINFIRFDSVSEL